MAIAAQSIADLPRRGILLMLAAWFMFSLVDTGAKWLAVAGVSAFQLAFMRYAGHFVISTALLARGDGVQDEEYVVRSVPWLSLPSQSLEEVDVIVFADVEFKHRLLPVEQAEQRLFRFGAQLVGELFRFDLAHVLQNRAQRLAALLLELECFGERFLANLAAGQKELPDARRRIVRATAGDASIDEGDAFANLLALDLQHSGRRMVDDPVKEIVQGHGVEIAFDCHPRRSLRNLTLLLQNLDFQKAGSSAGGGHFEGFRDW